MLRHIGRRQVLAAVTLAPWLAGGRSSRAAEDRMVPSLTRSAARNGRYFGAAARIDQIAAEPALHRAILRDCGWLTPEIHMKWDAIQPRRGDYAFEAADSLVAFASTHGLKVRGHTLLWEQSTPTWAKDALADTRDWRIVSAHIATVGSRYRGKVEAWDVVNEPVDTEGGSGGLRANSFLRAFGEDYISRALVAAREAAPGAQLAINDYGFDYDNPTEDARRRAFIDLLTRLKVAGVPIDAVGVQAHLDLGKGPIKAHVLAPFFQEIADLGLSIAITELDVRERDFSRPLAERDQRVADEARAYLDIALAQPAVKGVVTWGLSDRHSWLQDHETAARNGYNRGLPYDDSLQPKPMYWALSESLAARRKT